MIHTREATLSRQRGGKRSPGAEARWGHLVWAGAAYSAALSPAQQARVSHKCQYNSEARGIRSVLNNGQVRFVVENLIQDIGGIADGGGDDFGAILRELIAAPTIEGNAFAIAKVSRERPGITHLAPYRKALAI